MNICLNHSNETLTVLHDYNIFQNKTFRRKLLQKASKMVYIKVCKVDSDDIQILLLNLSILFGTSGKKAFIIIQVRFPRNRDSVVQQLAYCIHMGI